MKIILHNPSLTKKEEVEFDMALIMGWIKRSEDNFAQICYENKQVHIFKSKYSDVL